MGGGRSAVAPHLVYLGCTGKGSRTAALVELIRSRLMLLESKPCRTLRNR